MNMDKLLEDQNTAGSPKLREKNNGEPEISGFAVGVGNL